MHTRYFTFSLALALALFVGLGSADAGQELKGHFQGFFENNQIDTDGDGNLGATNAGHANGTLGHANFRGVGEINFQTAPVPCQLPGEAPPGTGLGFPLLLGSYTAAFDTGDLFSYDYTHPDAEGGVNCFHPTFTGPGFFDGRAVITGGTGRFAGATGTFHSTCTALTTYQDTDGNYSGWQVCDFDAQID